MALAFIWGRVLAPEGVAAQGGYAMSVSVREYLRHVRHFLAELLLRPGAGGEALFALLLLALLAAAVLVRSRILVLGWLLFTVGILPVAFIPNRGLDATIIPLTGLAVYASWWLVRLRRVPPAILFVAVGLTLVWAFREHVTLEPYKREHDQIASVVRQFRRLHPSLPAGTRILVLHDTFEERYTWANAFIVALAYRDQSISVVRSPNPAAVDLVVTFDDGKLVEIKRASAPVCIRIPCPPGAWARIGAWHCSRRRRMFPRESGRCWVCSIAKSPVLSRS
jgi:hypothetical protein